MRKLVKALGALALLGLVMESSAEVTLAQPAETSVRVLTFAGASNLPLYVAQDRGYFARNGLRVSLAYAHGALDQMHRMAHGPYEIATTAMDNVVGLTEGQGEAPIPGFDLVAFAGVHRGTAYIVSRPEITSYAQIRGRTVCVDAIGYAYGMVLYKALENHGLLPDRDYHVAAVGTSDKRLATMQHHKAVACLLSPPEDSEATALGYHVLGDTSSALGSIQVSIYAGHRAWLQSHRGVVVAFIRSVIAANDYIFANRAGSLAILRKHVRGLNASRAQAIYAGLTSPKVGLNRHAALDLQGVRNVLAVRSEFGRPKMSITDPNKYIDTSFYTSASRATPLR